MKGRHGPDQSIVSAESQTNLQATEPQKSSSSVLSPMESPYYVFPLICSIYSYKYKWMYVFHISFSINMFHLAEWNHPWSISKASSASSISMWLLKSAYRWIVGYSWWMQSVHLWMKHGKTSVVEVKHMLVTSRKVQTCNGSSQRIQPFVAIKHHTSIPSEVGK